MGKGTIISHIADGQYNVTVNYNSAAITTALSTLAAKETGLIALIAAEIDDTKKKLLRLQLLSVQKRIDYLNDTDNVPADVNIAAWCADLTEDLTGEVGLIEIGRERVNGVNIQPGYDANAAYDATRDGQLTPLMAQTAAATFYNLAMLPGAQKWKPTYLYGVISNIDYETDTASVLLDLINSSQQALDILQDNFSLENVPIEYMSCDSAAFVEGDRVLVKFENYDYAQPKIIGFESEPKPCDCFWTEEWDGPLVTTKWPWAADSGVSAFYYFPSPPADETFSYSLPSGAVTITLTPCTADPPQSQECSHITISGAEFTLSTEAGYELWEKSASAYYNFSYSDFWINENPVSFIANCDLNLSKLPYTLGIEFVGYLDGEWYYFDVLLKNSASSFFTAGDIGGYSEPFLWNGSGFYSVQHVYRKTGPTIYEFELIELEGWIQPFGYPNTYMVTTTQNNAGRIQLPEGLEGIKIYEAKIIIRYVSSSLTLPEWEVTINHIGVC